MDKRIGSGEDLAISVDIESEQLRITRTAFDGEGAEVRLVPPLKRDPAATMRPSRRTAITVSCQ